MRESSDPPDICLGIFRFGTFSIIWMLRFFQAFDSYSIFQGVGKDVCFIKLFLTECKAEVQTFVLKKGVNSTRQRRQGAF